MTLFLFIHNVTIQHNKENYLKTKFILNNILFNMTNLLHLQNALNKVITDVRHTTLEEFAGYITDKGVDLNNKEPQEIKVLVSDYLNNNTNNVFAFVPKKKEKKARPPNSYNLFIKDKMREIKEANPDFKGKELMKRATQAWNKRKIDVAQEVDVTRQ